MDRNSECKVETKKILDQVCWAHPKVWHEKLEETDVKRLAVEDRGVPEVAVKANYAEVGISRCNGDADSSQKARVRV